MRLRSVTLVAALSLLPGYIGPVSAAEAESGVLMSSSDRRSATAMVEDDAIESRSYKRITDKYGSSAQVSVSAFNRFALLTGTAANDDSKMDIERIVGNVPNVKGIANEIVVGATAGGSSRNDAFITSNVKARFLGSQLLRADHVRVITRDGVVYLMGLLSHAEANAASEIASTTPDVQKVVRVFEYIDQ